MKKFLLICLTALCSLVTQGVWAADAASTFTGPYECYFIHLSGDDVDEYGNTCKLSNETFYTASESSLTTTHFNYTDAADEVVVKGVTLSQGLKMEGATEFTFDTSDLGKMQLTVVLDIKSGNTEDAPVLQVDGTNYTATARGTQSEDPDNYGGYVITVDLNEGTHTISQGKVGSSGQQDVPLYLNLEAIAEEAEPFEITFSPASGIVTSFGPSIGMSNGGVDLSMIQGQNDGPYYVIKDNESNAAECYIESGHIMMYDASTGSTATTITDPGTYTLTIPAGILTDGTNTNAQSTVTYTIEGSSSGTVEAGTTFIYNDIAYTVNDDLTTVSVACQADYIDDGATGAAGDCVIPETVYDGSNNSFTVTQLAEHAFYGYGNTATGNNKNNTLTESIDLPASMKAFGSQALNGIQSQITYIVCRAVEPPAASSSTVFSTTTNYAALYVPCGSGDAYAAATGYNNFPSNKGIHEFGCEDGESHFTLEIDTRGEISSDGSTITIITEPAAVSVTEDSELSISILDEGENEVATATIAEGDQEGFWTLTITPAISESGTYTISIPEGYFTKDDELSSGASAEFSFLAATDYYPVTFTPADGAEVVSISEIELSNTDTGFTFNCDDDALSTITLSNGTTNVATVTSATRVPFNQSSSLYREVVLTLSNTITEDGTYTLTIPAGIISAEETTVTYIVDLFEITVGEATVASDDESLTVSITVPSGTTVATEAEKIIITEKHETDVVAYGVLTQEGGVWTLSFVDANGDPVALEGDDDETGTTYVATIPQGYFVSGEEKSAETTIEFTVIGTADTPTPSTFPFTQLDAEVDAEGKVVTLTVDPDVMQVENSGLEITITKEDDEEFSVTPTVSGSGETWTLTLETALTEGKYTVNIPAGYFETEAHATNEIASAEFEFTATEEGFALTFNPDPAESVTELSVIQVSSDEITSDDGNLNITAGEDNVNVTNKAGDVVAVAYWDNISADIGYAFELRDPTNTSTAITLSDPDTYTINIPEGFFHTGITNKTNKETEVSYTIGEEGTGFALTFIPDPAESVTELSVIQVSSDEITSDDGNLNITAGEDNVNVTNKAGDVVAVAYWDNINAEIGYAFELRDPTNTSTAITLSDPDTYTLKIPEGFFHTGITNKSSKEIEVSYTIAPIVETFDIEISDPVVAENEVTVTITSEETISIAEDAGQITITKEDDEDFIAYGRIDEQNADGTYTIYYVTESGAPVNITDEGKYTVTISQGFFTNADETAVNAEASVEFEIEADTPSTGGDTFVFDPADGSTVDSLSKISVTNGDNGLNPVYTGEDLITVTNVETGDVVATVPVDGVQEIFPEGDESGLDTEVIFTFDTEITDEGTYTVTIPAGILYYGTGTDVSDVSNGVITLTYTVAGKIFTITPEEGEVESLESIELTYDGGAIKMNGSTVDTYLLDEQGNKVAGVEALSSDIVTDEDGNTIGYKFAIIDLETQEETTITEPGTYTITIEAGKFLLGEDETPSPSVTITYTVGETAPEVETFDITISDPIVEENEVTVTITSEETISIAEDAGQITITKEDDEDFIAYGRVDGQNADGTYTIYYVTESGAPVNITAEGKYTVTIPQGFFTNADETAVNAEASVEFEIEADTPSTGGDTFVFDPADGSTVDSLSKISVTNGDNGLNPVYTGEDPITVTNVETGDVVATVPVDGVQEIFPEGDESGLDSEVIFTFDTEITDEGTYTVTIPAGILYYGTGTGVSDVSNGVITLTYTVAGKIFTFNPAEGEVDYLESIELTYDGGAIKMDGSVVDTYLVDEEGNKVAGVEALSSDIVTDEDGNTIGYKFAIIDLETQLETTITEPGTYTITIEAGEFLLGEDETPSPSVTITYTIVEPSASIDLLDEVEDDVFAITKDNEWFAENGYSTWTEGGDDYYYVYDAGVIFYENENITIETAGSTYVANNGYQIGDIQAMYPDYTAYINFGSSLSEINENTKIEDPSSIQGSWQGMLKVTPTTDGGLTFNVHAGGNTRTYGVYDVAAEEWVNIASQVTGDVTVYTELEANKEYLLVAQGTNSNLYQIAFPSEEPVEVEPGPEVEDEVIYTTDFTDWTDLSYAESNGVVIDAETTTGEAFTFTLWGVQVNSGDVSQTDKFEGEGALILAKYTEQYDYCEPYIVTSTISSVTKITFTEAATASNRGVKISVKGDGDDDWVVVYSTALSSYSEEVTVDINRENCQIKIENLVANQNAYILDFTIYGEVPAEEEALYATDFTEWATIDRTTANGDEVTVATTTGGNLTFTLWGVGVDPTKTDADKFPDYVGAMITAKYAEDGSAEYSVYEPFAVTSTLGTVDKVVFTQVATGSNRGIKVSVKGDGDEDWEVLYNETIHNAKGETIELDVNRTNCRIKFESFALAQNGYIADLKIYGTDATSETEDPYKQLYEDIKMEVDALGVDLIATWATIQLEYPESVEGLQSTYDAIYAEITNLQLVVEASHDGEELTTDQASIEAQVKVIQEEIDALTAAAASINSITIDNNFEGKSIYTISGQKVSAPTKAGIYIIDGKKVVIK